MQSQPGPALVTPLPRSWRRGFIAASWLLAATGLFVACGTDANSGFSGDPDAGQDSGGGGATSGNSSGSIGNPDGSPGGGDRGDGHSGPVCATGKAEASREPVYLHLVLDRSQSMDGHGNKSAGCDTRQPVPAQGSVCFLEGEREPDPLAPERTQVVCHLQNQTIDDCPAFRGLTGKKWLAARGALTAFFEATRQAGDPRIGVGMFLFDGRTNQGGSWQQWAVAPGFVDQAQADALKETVLPPNFATAGGTPLRIAIGSQATLLAGFEPQAPLESGGKRVLVVVTDGTPGDCGPNQQSCIDDVTALVNDQGITTFVVGIGEVDAEEGSVYNEGFLSRLAHAGGAAPQGCIPDWDGEDPAQQGQACHFQVTPGESSAAQIQAELSAALTEIAARAQSCELTLERGDAEIDPSRVNVVVTDADGQERQLPADPENGWTYDDPNDPRKVFLHGSACEELKADPDATIQIIIGCPTGTVVVVN